MRHVAALISAVKTIVVRRRDQWNSLHYYLSTVLFREITHAEERDARQAQMLVLDQTTLISSKLCFLLHGFTTLLDWSCACVTVQSLDELRQQVRDLLRDEHCRPVCHRYSAVHARRAALVPFPCIPTPPCATTRQCHCPPPPSRDTLNAGRKATWKFSRTASLR